MNRTLALLFVVSTLTSFGQTSWKSVNDIPRKWIMVERDSSGYLIYDPCNGGTPMITMDSGYITVFWQLDAPDKLVINKFTGQAGNRSFYINAVGGGRNMEFTAAIKDDKQYLVLWTFGGHKWVMVPFEWKDKLRQVDNPCHTQMKVEKQFLPVEF